MFFDFREELHLRTLKVCNHPADKCYSSVFQRPPPYKSDNNEKTKWNQSIGPAGRGGGRGVGCSRLYGLYRYVRPKRYGFSVVLVINRVSVLAILVRNRAWFLHSSLELSMFLRRSNFFIIIDKIKPSSKALHNLYLGQLSQPQQS